MTADKKRLDASLSPSKPSFEGIREVSAQVPASARLPRSASGDRAAVLEQIQLRCQPGGLLHSGSYCKNCSRFVNWVPKADDSEVRIRCLWNERDRAIDLMACLPSLTTVSGDTSLAEARALAAASGVSYLLVIGTERFGGVIYTDDLAGEGRVGDRLQEHSWCVTTAATLGDVVAMLRAHQTEFVAVLAEDKLVGIVTRATLVDAGLDVSAPSPSV